MGVAEGGDSEMKGMGESSFIDAQCRPGSVLEVPWGVALVMATGLLCVALRQFIVVSSSCKVSMESNSPSFMITGFGALPLLL